MARHTPNAAQIEMRDDVRSGPRSAIAAFSWRSGDHPHRRVHDRPPKAIGDIMIKRRDKILRTYLPAVNPIVTPRLEEHRLSFENAAVNADVARAPEAYRASWFHFDNATGESRPLAETTSAGTTIDAPADLPTGKGSFIMVELSADSREHQAWRHPIRTYFRLDGSEWKLVGLERMPDASADVTAQRVTAR